MELIGKETQRVGGRIKGSLIRCANTGFRFFWFSLLLVFASSGFRFYGATRSRLAPSPFSLVRSASSPTALVRRCSMRQAPAPYGVVSSRSDNLRSGQRAMALVSFQDRTRTACRCASSRWISSPAPRSVARLAPVPAHCAPKPLSPLALAAAFSALPRSYAQG